MTMREFEYIADQNQPRPGDDIDPLELNDGRDHGQGGQLSDQTPPPIRRLPLPSSQWVLRLVAFFYASRNFTSSRYNNKSS